VTSRSHQDRQRRGLTATEVDLERRKQRALLVGTGFGTSSVEEAEASLDELVQLTETAGAVAADRVLQRRATPDPATYIGKGKAQELKQIGDALDIDLVVFDDELTPAQQRNLEKIFGVDVVDRAALILDIFAQHANSQEGMIQVELAQLRYRLPRLRGRGLQLSQQAGGIGTRRGPGETQLEVDRRRLVRRVQKLERDLRDVAATRATQRKARQRRELLRVALVGYTNAGKSTLLNRLTNAGVLVEDQLFSTLDPTTRRLHLPGGETVLMSDTVGFVRKLPHQLVEAFRTTLDEVRDADLLVHLVDASAPEPETRIDAVDAVLREIGADQVPVLIVWTKEDLADRDDVKRLLGAHSGSVAISATSGEGIEDLLGAIGDRLRSLARVAEYVVPYDRGDVLAALHRAGEVLVEVHADGGTRVRARLPDASVGRFAEFSASAARDDR
jgi:GTP-binding protein HflX